MEDSKIAWTDNTFNPWVGCSKVSAGCANCYAERMAYRLACKGQDKYRAVVRGEGIVEDVDREGPLHGRWNGDVFLDESALADPKKSPLHWRKPRTIFVVSMGDLFYERVPFEFIDRTSLIGPPDRVQSRLQAYADAGVSTLTVATYSGSLDERLATLRTMSEVLAASGLGE